MAKDIVKEIADKFLASAEEFIEEELISPEGSEEESELAKKTVLYVLKYCSKKAQQYASTPEEFQEELKKCINEWYSTDMMLINRFLSKAIEEVRKKAKK